MNKYQVVIEGFGKHKTEYFDAETKEEAEEIGRDIFHEECNYGVSLVEEASHE